MYFKDFPEFLYDFDIDTKSGEGVPAVLQANLAGGGVNSVSVINGGSGYVTANVGFSAPQTTGVTATARAIIEDGVITQVVIINTGTGYTSPPEVSVSLPYKVEKLTKALVVKDITRNIHFRRDVFANITVYDEYDIVDGETPEIIAEKFYGNPEYHWIIMLANDKHDYRKDFPLDYNNLQDYINDKYGNEADNARYYEDERGLIVDSDHPGAVPVSNRQYEEIQNEKKRRIKIISPDLISTILKNYRDLL